MTFAQRPAHAAAVPDVRGLRVPERTLELLRDLISSRTGTFYDDGRLDLLRDRLSPLAIDRGFDSLLDYYYLLKYDAQAADEWPRVMDALSVQETYFWREADQFKALASAMVPRVLERRPRARIWSIPCASGEEPLSIAMALDQAGLFERAEIEIYASDASGAALARAERRRYGRRSFRQLPDHMRDRYFTKDAAKEEWIVKPDLHARVNAWTRVNIVDPVQTLGLSSCDVIFCRNLFIYFTPACVRDVASHLARSMPSPGYLCVGAAESLLKSGAGLDLQEIGGAYVYVKP